MFLIGFVIRSNLNYKEDYSLQHTYDSLLFPVRKQRQIFLWKLHIDDKSSPRCLWGYEEKNIGFGETPKIALGEEL